MVRPIFKLKTTESGEMELELPDKKVPDHPDNKKLEKRTTDSGDDFSVLNNGRRCTDVLFLLLIVCSWVAMTGLGLAATGIVPSKHIKQGDPSRLVNGLDYHGNLCGITNYITPGGDDVINLPKAYPMPSGLFVCVERCPSTNNFEEFICEYEVQHEIDQTLSAAAEIGGSALSDSSSTEKSLYMFYTSQKQCMPMIESSSFLGYCIPSKPLEDAMLGDSLSSNSNTTLGNNETASDASPSNNNTAITIWAEKKVGSEAFDIIMSDVHTVRYVIFGFGCGMAMALGIVFLIIIQLPCILNLLVWTMIIAIDVAFVYAGWYTKGVSATWEALGRPGNEALALYYGSYVLYTLAVLWLVTILFLRKRILLAVACVKEASRAISALPLMTLFPVCQVLCLFAFTVVWGVYMAYLASSGEITPSCVCPNDFGSDQMVPEIDANSGLDGSMMCDEGCFMFKELTYASNTKYAGLFLVFVWFWTSQFIVAVGQLVVALAVSIWYFTRDRKQVGNSTFIKSVCLVSVYHLGTAAFGSLIIAIIKTIRAILTYIQKKATKSRLRLAMVILTVLKCLLWCLEKCLKFVNKQAYIQTAIHSYSFCKAARLGFFLILRNALRISAVSIVSQAVLFINKVFITVASTAGGYYYLEYYYGNQLNSLMAPTLLIAICSYAVSEMFDEVFGMAISTILQCFVTDEEMYEPGNRFAPKDLCGTLESTQKKYKRKKNSTATIGVGK